MSWLWFAASAAFVGSVFFGSMRLVDWYTVRRWDRRLRDQRRRELRYETWRRVGGC